jgi:uncharacterized membrane protein YGL010W
MRPGLLQWQLDGYPEFHRGRANLLIHVVAVPAFIASVVALVANLVMTHWVNAGVSFGVTVVAFAVQGVGHKREATPPIPFSGPGDAVTRILAEQFITFPRFLFSGGWDAAFRHS